MAAKTRAAAIQIEAEVGDIDHNLELSRHWVDVAAGEGARWIVLPEFFSTGVGNLPELAYAAPPPNGAPTRLLKELAERYRAHVGGSTLVRDADGHVRNAFFLAGPDGALLGRHDKDLPTMWESALYVGGEDAGLIAAGDTSVGAALCWELLRAPTLERLRGKVDLIVGGSGWWSIPTWPPRRWTDRLERGNRARALAAPGTFARAVGAPMIHAAHSGPMSCPWPLGGVTYRGHFEGGAMICGADGTTLALRTREEGPGLAIADVELGRSAGVPVADRYWFQRRGAIAAFCWRYQGAVGRRVYRRQVGPEGSR